MMTPKERVEGAFRTAGYVHDSREDLAQAILVAEITEAEDAARKQVSDKVCDVLVNLYNWSPVLARAVGFLEQPPAESEPGHGENAGGSSDKEGRLMAVRVDHTEEFGLVCIHDGKASAVGVPFATVLWPMFCGEVPDPTEEDDEGRVVDAAYWDEYEYCNPREVVSKFIADVGHKLAKADYRLWSIADVRAGFGKAVDEEDG